MRWHSRLYSSAVVLMLTTACAGDPASATCSEERFLQASLAVEDTGWRARVLDSLAGVPADEPQEAVMRWVRAPGPADSAFVASHDGTIEYEFRSFAGWVVGMPAGRMRGIADSVHHENLRHMELGSALIPLECR